MKDGLGVLNRCINRFFGLPTPVNSSLLMEYRRVSLMMNSGVWCKDSDEGIICYCQKQGYVQNKFQNPISREKQPR